MFTREASWRLRRPKCRWMFVLCALSVLSSLVVPTASQVLSCHVDVGLNPSGTAQCNVSATVAEALAPPWNITFNTLITSDASNASWAWTPTSRFLEGTSVAGEVTDYWQSLVNGSQVELAAALPKTGIIQVAVEGSLCSVATLNDTAVSDVGEEAGQQPISVTNGQLIGVDGNPMQIRGINYFGFEVAGGTGGVDGLWAGPSSLSLDFSTVAYRIQLLGFNAVRLPFSFQNLYENLTPPQNPGGPCDTVGSDVIAAKTTDPAVQPNGPLPVQATPAPQTPGFCNTEYPNDTVLNRFMYVMHFFAANGLYVVIDNHLNTDPTASDNGPQWVKYWTQLAQSIAADPVLSPYIMFEILNEPDSRMMGWSVYGPLALQAMDAITGVTPGAVLMIEGTEQVGHALSWGNGFITDTSYIAANGIGDPNPFFQQLMGKPYLNNVVIAPHLYGWSITKSTYAPADLYAVLSRSVGYLNKQGYCMPNNGACHVFPIVVTETGSRLEAQEDLDFYAAFTNYIKNANDGADGLHNAIDSVMFWSYNANSGDTGGIVQDDWQTVNWNKVQLMQNLVGLAPWYLGSAAPTGTPSPAGSPAPPGTPVPSGTPSPAGPPAPTSTPTPTSTPCSGCSSSSGGSVESASGPVAPVPLNAIRVTPQILSGTLSDISTALQALQAMGFNGIELPVNFSAGTPLPLANNCVVPKESALRLQLLSSAAPASLKSIPLPYEASPSCNNGLISHATLFEQVAYMASMAVSMQMYVLISGMDAQMALDDPDVWLQQWVQLASVLPDNPFITLVLFDTSMAGTLAWQSTDGNPGRSELYKVAVEAVQPVLPQAAFALLSNGQKQVSLNAVTALQVITTDNSTGVSANSSWVLHIDVSGADLPWSALQKLQAIGLKPWYVKGRNIKYGGNPESAVESSPVPYVQPELPCSAIVSKASDGIWKVSVSNNRNQTIMPPWQMVMSSKSLTGVVKSFGLRDTTFRKGNGTVTGWARDYNDVLWPGAKNTLDFLFVFSSSLGSSAIESSQSDTTGPFADLTVQVGGYNCVLPTLGQSVLVGSTP